jgi:hypothetical protein
LGRGRSEALTEAKDLIAEKIGKNRGTVFPIFFDECDEIGSTWSIEEFLFVKNAIRCMFCVPIFISTDMKPSNFLGNNLITFFGSRDEESDFYVWCLLWYKIPDFIVDVMQEKAAYIERKQVEAGLLYPTSEARNFLYKWALRERPLLLQYINEYLDFMCQKCIRVGSDFEFLRLLFPDVLDHFRMGKRNKWEWFNNGQLAYLSSFYWNTDHNIHGHMAKIKAKPFDPDHPYFSKLSASIPVGMYNFEYVRKYIFRNSTPCLFQLLSEYESFFSNPLLGFVMLGIDANHQSVFCGMPDNLISVEEVRSIRNRSQAPRISTMNSIYQNSGIDLSHVVGYATPHTSGTILELALLGSSMLATRVGSLYGTSVQDFLNPLCWELDFAGCNMAPIALRTVDERFLAAFSGFKIPFVSPMASEVWDRDFVKDLSRVCRVDEPYLGIAYPSVSAGDRCDFAMSVWGPETPALPKNQLPGDPIIVGQCKMYSGRVGARDFNKEIFTSFDRLGSEL